MPNPFHISDAAALALHAAAYLAAGGDRLCRARDMSGALGVSHDHLVWTFAENGESIAPLCGHSKHLDEGVGNFARER